MVKKVNNLYPKKYISDNRLKKVIDKSIKNKSRYKIVKEYKKNPEKYKNELREIILNKNFHVSEYEMIQKITDNGKVRNIPKVPIFHDQTIQNFLISLIGYKWIKTLTDDCYNCIPRRGINSKNHKWNMNSKLKRDIIHLTEKGKKTAYYFKCDIYHHYPTIKHSVYRRAYMHDCKDKDIIEHFDRLNYSLKGLPIGWPSGAIASHIILRELDHWIKEELKVKYYYRFADDIVILSDDKKYLHTVQWRIRNFMWYVLKQEMKKNYRVSKIEEGIDFGGYVFYPTHTALRKRIKKSYIKKRNNKKSVSSYLGILKYCDSKNLYKKVQIENNKHMTNIKDLNLKIEKRFWGQKISIESIVDEEIKILDFDVRDSTKTDGGYWTRMQIEYLGKKRFVKTSSTDIARFLKLIDRNLLPLENVVIKKDEGKFLYFEGTIAE